MGMKNFSSAWIKGSTNQKISNVVDHATSEQHTTAMAQMQADNAKALKVPLAHYAPIAKCFSKMDAVTKERLKKKFVVCYLLYIYYYLLLFIYIWHFLSTQLF